MSGESGWQKGHLAKKTMKWANEYGGVEVKVEPVYEPNPPRLRDGTPIPKGITRRVTKLNGEPINGPGGYDNLSVVNY